MAKLDWKLTNFFRLLQRQVKDYNIAYNLIDICVSGQSAPASPVANDCYYYTGSTSATVFGVTGVTANSFLGFVNATWILLPVVSQLQKAGQESKNYLEDPNALYTANELEMILAIVDVKVINPNLAKRYCIQTICNNHTTLHYGIYICEKVSSESIYIPIATVANPTGINLIDKSISFVGDTAINFLITIDYSKFTATGVYGNLNVSLSKLVLSKQCCASGKEALLTDLALTNTAISALQSSQNSVLGNSGLSPNYSYGHPYIYARVSYSTGHSAITDIGTVVPAPTASGFATDASKVVAFSTNTGSPSYFIGMFNVDLLTLLQSYDTADGSAISPVTMKLRVYNSHASAAATINIGFRTKKNSSWYTPAQTITIPAGAVMSVSIDFVMSAGERFTTVNSYFDVYGYATSPALESDPAWIYFGDMDVYFTDVKIRAIRPVIKGASLIGGIKTAQLDATLQAKIGTSAVPRSKIGIVCSGSSITWGGGLLDDSFVGIVDDFIKSKLAQIILPVNMTFSEVPTIFSNAKQYKGAGSKLVGLNKKVSFTIQGDELVICQTSLRSTDWGKMQVKAGGIIIGSFTNHNKTLGSTSESFTGNGTNVKFQLSKSCTYGHTITVAGVSKTSQINTGGYGSTFPVGVDAFVIRSLNSNGDPIHVVWFATAPANGVSIVVNYNFGQIIAHERSQLGQTTDDSINESAYGDGSTSFDPANPSNLSSGMEFRGINELAIWKHKFISSAERAIEIEIIAGTNPYFIINYASNRFHNLLNAGIGGWSISALTDGNKINDYGNFYKFFMPEIIIQESATNDDWSYGARRLTRTVTGLTEAQVKSLCTLELKRIALNGSTFDVDFTTGIISSISAFSLICPQIIGSATVIGNIVRIGTYHGDNKQIVCRSIESVNLSTGEISWLEPINYELMLNVSLLSDLVGSEVSIRDLSGYQAAYETLIQNLQKASPQTKILIAQPGLSNYFQRQLWGYETIHRRLVQKYLNVEIIEITDLLHDFQKGNISGASYLDIPATGASSYDLLWTGHWQGFRVLVNNQDVYGKDCYVQSGSFYAVDQSGTGAALNLTGDYNKSITATKSMKLVFTKNIPYTGTIRIEKADSVWSSDYTHPTADGNYVYGQAYISKLNEIL